MSIYEYQEKHMRQEREHSGKRTRNHLKQDPKETEREKSISVIAEEVEEEKSVIEQIIREWKKTSNR